MSYRNNNRLLDGLAFVACVTLGGSAVWAGCACRVDLDIECCKLVPGGAVQVDPCEEDNRCKSGGYCCEDQVTSNMVLHYRFATTGEWGGCGLAKLDPCECEYVDYFCNSTTRQCLPAGQEIPPLTGYPSKAGGGQCQG